MKEIRNETLKNIVEQLSDIVAVSDDVMKCLEAEPINSRLPKLQTEISRLLEGEADAAWYRLIAKVCTQDEYNMWVYEIVNAFRKTLPPDVVEEALDKAESVRKFQSMLLSKSDELLLTKSENRSVTEKASEKQLSDTVAVSKKNDTEEHTLHVVEEYMDKQISGSVGSVEPAEQLILLAMQTRDTLKEYQNRIMSLENIVASQKQLLDHQRQSLRTKVETIENQKLLIEKYEKKLEQIEHQYNDMNQTLLRLNNIHTSMALIGQEQ